MTQQCRWHQRLYQIVIFSLLLSSCSSIPSPQERNAYADQIAHTHGWQAQDIVTAPFTLRSYVPKNISFAEHLSIYIEGDGLAWISRDQASSDPTPRRPVALTLALAQPEGNAVYLGRPCQYGSALTSLCEKKYWTSARFAPEVIASSNQAIEQLKKQFGAQRLTLVGYSGGAAIALLLAARRNDVTEIITVAGNLDHQAWTSYHRITPLTDSLNPLNYRDVLRNIRQTHLVGEKDKIIPAELTQDFLQKLRQSEKMRMIVVPDYDHQCCWEQSWPRYWQQIHSAP